MCFTEIPLLSFLLAYKVGFSRYFNTCLALVDFPIAPPLSMLPSLPLLVPPLPFSYTFTVLLTAPLSLKASIFPSHGEFHVISVLTHSYINA